MYCCCCCCCPPFHFSLSSLSITHTTMPPSSSTTPSLPADDLASPRLQNLQQTHEGEHHGDYGGGVEIPITRSTYIYAFCAALNSCNLGYDVGVSTNVGGLIQDDFGLSDRQREVFVGAINFWSMFGAIFSNVVSDKFGRRRSFVVAAVLFILGVLIQSTANSLTLLHIGRFFVGVGVGFGLAIDPLYISEASPAKHRGELVTWSEIALNIGIVLGFTSGLVFYSLQDSVEWRVMIGMGGILPLVMIGLVYTVMPESPRWLVSKQREQEAKQVLSTIYPPNYNVDYVVDDIKEALEREEQAEHAVGWSVIFWNATPAIRRMLLVGVGTAIAQQAVGIDAIQYYLIDVLDESGVKSEQAQLVVLIILGLIKLGFVFVGGKLFDKRGRRPLLFASLIGMTVALLLVGIMFYSTSKESTGFAVFGLALYLAFFSIGMGPGAWLVPSEIFATCIRAKAMSVATFLNRATATLMASTFLSTADAISWAGFFCLLAGICVVVLIFLYFLLPETKGRSLEDMSMYFAEITRDASILEAEAKILAGQSPKVEVTTNTTTMMTTPSSYQMTGRNYEASATQGEVI